MRKAIIIIAAVLAFSALAFFVMKPQIKDKILRYRYPLAYEDIISDCAEKYDLPPELICAVILAESSFEPDARSSAGAVGLMQLTSIANEDICNRSGMDINADLTDPEINIQRGCYYLAYLMRQFDSRDAAVAAYNAGYGNVKSWLADKYYSDDGKTLKYIPFEETRNYVERVNSAAEKYRVLYFTETEEN